MQWRIRVYRPGDEWPAAALAAACFESFRPWCDRDGQLLYQFYNAPGEIAARQSAGAQMLLADDGTAAPVCGVIELRDFRHISMLLVAPDRRRCGIARSLVERAVALARKVHPDLSRITVLAQPDAAEFYRRLGFVDDGPPATAAGVRMQPMRREPVL